MSSHASAGEDRPILRHTQVGIFLHWFNAASWFFLLATGLALLDNHYLGLMPKGYVDAVRALFGGGGNLLAAHWVVGSFWAAVMLVMAAAFARTHTLPFLRQIVSYDPWRDGEWMLKKQVQMVFGYRIMAKLTRPINYDPAIPDQPYYNAGQKLAAVGLVLSALGLVATGVLMVLSKYVFGPEWTTLVQWSILAHFILAGLTTGLLMVHIFMAGIASEERPALISMFTGSVPASYAKHHHRLWYDQVAEK